MATYSLDPQPVENTGDLIVGDAGLREKDKLLLGRLIEAGPRRNLWLDISGEQVVAIFGKRGTGKSYTLGVLIEGLAAGAGPTKLAHVATPRAALVLDIMDIFWTSQIPLSPTGSPEIAKQYQIMKDRGFDPAELSVDTWIPAGFENSEIDPPNLKSLRIQASDLELDDWGALFDVDIFTEPRGMLIADAVSHVSQSGYDTRSGTRVSAKKGFGLPELLACLSDDAEIARNYNQETIRSIRQRMSTFAALPLFTGAGTGLADLLRPFRVAVLMLARVPDNLKKVVVAVLLKRILRDRRDASFAQKRVDLDSRLSPEDSSELRNFVVSRIPRTWVLMDEAHVLAGSSEGSVARDALVKFAKEGRNYGLSLAVATQQPSALDPRLTSQAETLIVHQLTAPADAAIACQNMRSPIPDKIRIDGIEVPLDILLRRLGQGEMSFSCGNAPTLKRMCVASTRPRVTAHGGYEA